MARNIIRTAEQGRDLVRQNRRLDLTASELEGLLELIRTADNPTDGLYLAIGSAYFAGLAVGNRHGRKAATPAAEVLHAEG